MDIIFSCPDTITLITVAKTLIIANPGCFPWTSQANNYSPNRKCPSDSPPPESSWVRDSPPFPTLQPQLRESILQWVPKTRVSAPPPPPRGVHLGVGGGDVEGGVLRCLLTLGIVSLMFLRIMGDMYNNIITSLPLFPIELY